MVRRRGASEVSTQLRAGTELIVCTKCEVPRSSDRFSRRGAGDDRVRMPCKNCCNAALKTIEIKAKRAQLQRNWRQNNPEGARRTYLGQYNLTPEEYEEMLQQQGGVCAICGGVNLDNKRLAVDHDHRTGWPRGLLCVGCNSAIGFLKDYSANCRRAANYLDTTESVVISCRCGYIAVILKSHSEQLPTCPCGERMVA